MSTSGALTNLDAPLVREAGVPFQPPVSSVDPFVEWISLMEVVEMLCPTERTLSNPTLGGHWKL